MKTTRTNEPLWNQVKEELMKQNKGKWDARLAQRAIVLYKARGGEYVGKKDPKNSLVKWTKENWQYAGEPGKSRYLPKKVIDSLPASLRKKENKKKSDKLGQRVPYSEDLKKIMRSKNIF